jgi:XTP/dITP diphosphohydrolase
VEIDARVFQFEEGMKWVLATRNAGKVAEFQRLADELDGGIEWLSLRDIGFHEEVEEHGNTLAENARLKSWAVHRQIGLPVLSDDSGLFVDALDGAPGVRSARFAGEDSNDENNNTKLLRMMEGIEVRNAHFSVVLCAVMDGKEMLFEGRVEGAIAKSLEGNDGFGYDPLFIPIGFMETFAKISWEHKDAISHRRRAMEQFLRWKKNFFKKKDT